MSEHLFSHGPYGLPPADVMALLERVAQAHGLTVVTYPGRTEFDSRWAFSGPHRGRFDDADVEERVRAALDAEPLFRTWVEADDYARHGWERAMTNGANAERRHARRR
jgi:hypothetical protein